MEHGQPWICCEGRTVSRSGQSTYGQSLRSSMLSERQSWKRASESLRYCCCDATMGYCKVLCDQIFAVGGVHHL